MNRVITVVILLVLFAGSATATTRYVSPTGTGQYLTILAAINASANGDTILIGPGTYNEGMQFIGQRTVIGAGWDQTTLLNQIAMVNSNNYRSVFEGLRVANAFSGFAVQVGAGVDSITFRRCRFESNNVVATISGDRVTIEDCIFIETGFIHIVSVSTNLQVFRNCLFFHASGNSNNRYAFSGSSGRIEIYNSVFLGFLRLLNLTGTQPVTFINNIVYDWAGAGPSYGTFLAGSVFAYNASDVISPPGDSAIVLTADPFVSYDETANWNDSSDLHLAEGAPVIDAGHPSVIDLDSTRSDMGLYGGPRPLVENGIPSYPFVLSLSANPILIGVGDTVEVNSSARVGPRY